MKQLRTIADYQEAALAKLPAGMADYVQKTAGTGRTLAANIDAFSHYRLIPRVLQCIERVDTVTTALGKKIAHPIMIAPTAWHKMFSKEGEHATSEAAKSFGVPYVISSFSSSDFKEIGSDLSHAWYQLLVYKDKKLMREYISCAEEAGCSALVLTVDAPLGCSMCKSSDASAVKPNFPVNNLPLFPIDSKIPYKTLDEYYPKYIDHAASWFDISKIIDSTKIPVVIKGVLHPKDMKEAVRVGARGIIVSNHGGRQLDGAISSLDALATVPNEVKRKIDVYMDGGIRNGVDIFKAIALGAREVLIGRPALYGLAVNGKAGLEHVLSILDEELRECMHMTGCATVKDITRDLVQKQ